MTAMKLAPLCRYCGEQLQKSTQTIYFRDRALNDYERHTNEGSSSFQGYVQVATFPNTTAECQRLVNSGTVVSVRYSQARGSGIGYCSVWDGESYKDEFFCTGDHARRFAYIVAREGRCTKAYNDAIAARAEIAR